MEIQVTTPVCEKGIGSVITKPDAAELIAGVREINLPEG